MPRGETSADADGYYDYGSEENPGTHAKTRAVRPGLRPQTFPGPARSARAAQGTRWFWEGGSELQKEEKRRL